MSVNKERRNLLSKAQSALNTAENYVTQALDDEQDCLGNMPENLEGSERYEKMEAAVEQMEYAVECITNAYEALDEASE